jgi:Uma2 family endonuclease
MLVVEVADTTLRYDRKTKVSLYARHGIVEYWIVDLERGQLDRYRDPCELAYARVDRPDVRVPISLAAMPHLRLGLAVILA